MKTLRFISTFCMLALATVVTAGSLYVTVSAATQQDSAEVIVAPQEAVAVLDDATLDLAVDAAIERMDSALDKTQILRDYQSHVILDANGGFTGRLSSLGGVDGEQVPARDLQVRLAQHGAVIGSTTTDANGRFSFTGLGEGVVAIWAEGDSTLMLFSIALFAQDTAIAENAELKAAQLELDMDAAVVSGADIGVVKELLSPYLNIEAKRFGTAVTSEDEEFSFGSGEAATTIRHSRVRLQNDGTLQGELSLLDERTGRLREVLDVKVHLVHNGVQVASSKVSGDGSFIVSGLTEGVHSIVAVGQDGVLVSSVDIVGTPFGDNLIQDAGVGELTPVSTVATSLELAGGFGGSPVGPMNARALGGASGTGDGAAPDCGLASNTNPGGGGGTGGGGGGGGAGAGAGGLGALLAGGIGGAIGYLAGDNNNDNPASPGI